MSAAEAHLTQPQHADCGGWRFAPLLEFASLVRAASLSSGSARYCVVLGDVSRQQRCVSVSWQPVAVSWFSPVGHKRGVAMMRPGFGWPTAYLMIVGDGVTALAEVAFGDWGDRVLATR